MEELKRDDKKNIFRYLDNKETNGFCIFLKSKKKKKKKKRGSAASDREEGNSHAIPFAYTIHIKYNENSI